MATTSVLDDPMLFSVWAKVESNHLRQAAEHLATEAPLSLAQFYQVVKKASTENCKVRVWSARRFSEASELANTLPAGFVVGSGAVAEDITNPNSSAYCSEHACYYGRNCSVCQGDYL
jgi:hypothetical protein